jgi:hypothetical protein
MEVNGTCLLRHIPLRAPEVLKLLTSQRGRKHDCCARTPRCTAENFLPIFHQKP